MSPGHRFQGDMSLIPSNEMEKEKLEAVLESALRKKTQNLSGCRSFHCG
jgi:hypothetical protein